MEQNKTATKTRKYKTAETVNVLKNALSNLEKTKQPGEAAGVSGKKEILISMRSEIHALVKKGYTAKQIAEAISGTDVFSILPKTITEMFSVAEEKKKTVCVKKQTDNKTLPLDLVGTSAASNTENKTAETGQKKSSKFIQDVE